MGTVTARPQCRPEYHQSRGWWPTPPSAAPIDGSWVRRCGVVLLRNLRCQHAVVEVHSRIPNEVSGGTTVVGGAAVGAATNATRPDHHAGIVLVGRAHELVVHAAAVRSVQRRAAVLNTPQGHEECDDGDLRPVPGAPARRLHSAHALCPHNSLL